LADNIPNKKKILEGESKKKKDFERKEEPDQLHRGGTKERVNKKETERLT